ncbi:MAG TPA: divergent PAP2 family protein [Candidatus Andersenbacteria bacterium]|nr:divergent PAP2 family protein [Candidatus Andersenbacteria bacterium]
MNTPLFLIPVVVGLMTQFSKRFFNHNWVSKTDGHPIHLPRYGGMPSAHSAFAFSLLTIVGYTSGLSSSLFAIAVVLAIIILDDALRMRIFLGRHGEALVRLILLLPKDQQKNFPHLEKKLGHEPIEALIGACIGIVTSLLFLFLLV